MAHRTDAKTHGAERGLTASKDSATRFRNRADPADCRDQSPEITRRPAWLQRPGEGRGGAVARTFRAGLLLVIGAYGCSTTIRAVSTRRAITGLAPSTSVPAADRRHSLSDPRLVVSSRNGLESVASMALAVGLAADGLHLEGQMVLRLPGRRVMDERLAPDFIQQMTRRYGLATVFQIAAVPLAVVAPCSGVSVALSAPPSSCCRSRSLATSPARSRARRRKRTTSCRRRLRAARDHERISARHWVANSCSSSRVQIGNGPEVHAACRPMQDVIAVPGQRVGPQRHRSLCRLRAR